MTQTIPLKATLLLRHKRILRHRGAHLNMRLREQRGVYCSTLWSALYGVRASASHFNPALGTRERNESFSLFFVCILCLWQQLYFSPISPTLCNFVALLRISIFGLLSPAADLRPTGIFLDLR